MSSEKVSVLVVGAGMYVCGRGTPGLGTILPTLAESQARGEIGEIFVAATSSQSGDLLQSKLDEINRLLGTAVVVRKYPREGKDPKAYREALRDIPRPASAIVSIPDSLHFAVTRDLIEEGIHPLVVKPLVPTLREARELLLLLKERRLHGAVEFHKRHDEANLILRRTIQEGRLGKLRYLTVEFSQRRRIRDILGTTAQEADVFQYLGVHYVDLIHFVTGAIPRRVVATGQPVGASPSSLDSIQAMIDWNHGDETFSSLLATNWIDPNTTSAMSDQKLTVVGTAGRYQSDQKNRGVQLVTEKNGIEEINPYFTQIFCRGDGVYQVDGYGPRSIRQFLGDVRAVLQHETSAQELEEMRPSFRQALISTAVIEAVRRSLLEQGKWIPIETDELG